MLQCGSKQNAMEDQVLFHGPYTEMEDETPVSLEAFSAGRQDYIRHNPGIACYVVLRKCFETIWSSLS